MTEAQRLADLLAWSEDDIAEQAAAELRRLDEAHDWQYRMAGDRLRRIEVLEAECKQLRAELRRLDAEFTACYSSLVSQEEKNAALQAECEQLRKYKAAAMLMVEDASRYIWLRDSQEGKTVRIMDRRQWDEAIDAAMKETK